ncbi:MAG TPA: YciI family protein [Ktedonobacteraceae bacterium]|nr:YciI family protein [Ktedonobacteraceae bacterium]
MERLKKTFVIFFKPGNAWTAGKTSREQPYWTEHAAFMDALFEDGTVIMGGPFADYSSILVIIEASDENTVRELFKRDPFIVQGILHLSSVHEWVVFLDARKK